MLSAWHLLGNPWDGEEALAEIGLVEWQDDFEKLQVLQRSRASIAERMSTVSPIRFFSWAENATVPDPNRSATPVCTDPPVAAAFAAAIVPPEEESTRRMSSAATAQPVVRAAPPKHQSGVALRQHSCQREADHRRIPSGSALVHWSPAAPPQVANELALVCGAPPHAVLLRESPSSLCMPKQVEPAKLNPVHAVPAIVSTSEMVCLGSPPRAAQLPAQRLSVSAPQQLDPATPKPAHAAVTTFVASAPCFQTSVCGGSAPHVPQSPMPALPYRSTAVISTVLDAAAVSAVTSAPSVNKIVCGTPPHPTRFLLPTISVCSPREPDPAALSKQQGLFSHGGEFIADIRYSLGSLCSVSTAAISCSFGSGSVPTTSGSMLTSFGGWSPVASDGVLAAACGPDNLRIPFPCRSPREDDCDWGTEFELVRYR